MGEWILCWDMANIFLLGKKLSAGIRKFLPWGNKVSVRIRPTFFPWGKKLSAGIRTIFLSFWSSIVYACACICNGSSLLTWPGSWKKTPVSRRGRQSSPAVSPAAAWQPVPHTKLAYAVARTPTWDPPCRTELAVFWPKKKGSQCLVIQSTPLF